MFNENGNKIKEFEINPSDWFVCSDTSSTLISRSQDREDAVFLLTFFYNVSLTSVALKTFVKLTEVVFRNEARGVLGTSESSSMRRSISLWSQSTDSLGTKCGLGPFTLWRFPLWGGHIRCSWHQPALRIWKCHGKRCAVDQKLTGNTDLVRNIWAAKKSA